ncbi:hypothetical protein ACFL1U_01115 [Patescibacteria group bacterium]
MFMIRRSEKLKMIRLFKAITFLIATGSIGIVIAACIFSVAITSKTLTLQNMVILYGSSILVYLSVGLVAIGWVVKSYMALLPYGDLVFEQESEKSPGHPISQEAPEPSC